MNTEMKLNKAEQIVLSLAIKNEPVAFIASRLNKPGVKVTALQCRRVNAIINNLTIRGLLNTATN